MTTSVSQSREPRAQSLEGRSEIKTGGRGTRSAGRGALLLLLLFSAACSTPPNALAVEAGRISVSNLTEDDWVDVEIKVNRYYEARLPRLARGARFDAPLRRFQGGFGRYFDSRRERVETVEVTARTVRGAPVALRWPARS